MEINKPNNIQCISQRLTTVCGNNPGRTGNPWKSMEQIHRNSNNLPDDSTYIGPHIGENPGSKQNWGLGGPGDGLLGMGHVGDL